MFAASWIAWASRRSLNSCATRPSIWKNSGRELLKKSASSGTSPYRQVLDVSRGVEWARWFTGGKLNIAANCLDRHREATRPAIIAEREDGTVREIGFAELLADANRLANALRRMGIERGDRAALVHADGARGSDHPLCLLQAGRDCRANICRVRHGRHRDTAGRLRREGRLHG